MSLMSLQGAVNLATRLTSATVRPGPFRFVGQTDACSVELGAETVTQIENYTGQRLPIGELSLGKSGSISMTLKDWTLENLALAMYGKVVKNPSGTVTSEPLPSDVAVGDRIRLDHPFISDVVLTDTDPLVPGTDYIVDSPSAGIIKLLTPAALTATVAYSYASNEMLGLFTSSPPERWMLFDGINTENEERVVIQFYRVKFSPVSDLSLLHNEGYGELPITANVLADLSQPKDSALGFFGSYMQQAAE
ncbi:hypothetical protein FHU10_1260 [Serratia fonticola]|uniref:Uncharacterized protein n=1 Tax=Serratia fonticola TaxID=47917 RepID=A0A542BJE3_SERFO|nr:hypothetical protein [Serratia fonticola]TQI78699.1 hypothetical protein FHU09_1191 [Serratia fonticola]TQI99279.1 hypothetical protein FHU11_4861 [Serratia fonticola]TVZ68804.1 hypothetical protein FHU10_1260 [Serratia fonticola]